LDLEDTGLATFNCPYNDGLTYSPTELFQNFSGEDSQGDWILTVTDNAFGDGGSLDGWTLEICFIASDCHPFLDITEDYSNQTIIRQAEIIEANNTISNNATVTYKAGNSITLKADFMVEAGSEFLAIIEDCPVQNLITPPTEDAFRKTKIKLTVTV